ncbi:hypothetical protein MRB53_010812 [Persea americana]|uniref:Uncharacterized protein n=1 Tax=Persea americana TaxID=3435 RepID=A0ACC2LT71_PERAE|nr:hypothetical protein MRB53_010812 [Persea americana]
MQLGFFNMVLGGVMHSKENHQCPMVVAVAFVLAFSSSPDSSNRLLSNNQGSNEVGLPLPTLDLLEDGHRSIDELMALYNSGLNKATDAQKGAQIVGDAMGTYQISDKVATEAVAMETDLFEVDEFRARGRVNNLEFLLNMRCQGRRWT